MSITHYHRSRVTTRNPRTSRVTRGTVPAPYSFCWLEAVPGIDEDYALRLQDALRAVGAVPIAERPSDATLMRREGVYFVVRLGARGKHSAHVEVCSCTTRARHRVPLFVEGRRIGPRRLAHAIKQASDAVLAEAEVEERDSTLYELRILRAALGYGGYALLDEAKDELSELVAQGVDLSSIGLWERRMRTIARGTFQAAKYVLLATAWLVLGSIQLAGWILSGAPAKR